MTDEGAGFGLVHYPQGVFRRLRAASSFAHGGKGTKTPPGTAPDEHFVAHSRLSPGPHYGGYPFGPAMDFRRAKSEWRSAFSPGPLGPGFAKIAAGAVPLLRLTWPSQRLWRGNFVGRGLAPAALEVSTFSRARRPGRAARFQVPFSHRPSHSSSAPLGQQVTQDHRRDRRRASSRPSGVRPASQITASPRNRPARRSQASCRRAASSESAVPPAGDHRPKIMYRGRTDQPAKQQPEQRSCSQRAQQGQNRLCHRTHRAPPPGHPMPEPGRECRKNGPARSKAPHSSRGGTQSDMTVFCRYPAKRS